MNEPLLFSPWIDLALLLLGSSVALGFALARGIPRTSEPLDEYDPSYLLYLDALSELPAAKAARRCTPIAQPERLPTTDPTQTGAAAWGGSGIDCDALDPVRPGRTP